MSRTVQYQDAWGREHDARGDAHASCIRTIRVDDLRSILLAFSDLTPRQQEVFLAMYCDGVAGPTELAEHLGWSSRGSAANMISDVKRKARSLLSCVCEPQDLVCPKCGAPITEPVERESPTLPAVGTELSDDSLEPPTSFSEGDDALGIRRKK